MDSDSGDYSTLFKSANLAVGGITALLGLTQLFIFGVQSTLLSIYITGAGVLVAYLEFKVPPATYKYFSFLFSFIGRGLFYILLGILISQTAVRSILGALVIIAGAGFTVLEFIPSIDLPENMQINEGGFMPDDDGEDII